MGGVTPAQIIMGKNKKPTFEDYIILQEKVIEKRNKFIEKLKPLIRSENLNIKATPVYSSVFGATYRVNPKNFKNEKTFLNSYKKMKKELLKDDNFYINKKEAAFKRYLSYAMRGYAPHIFHIYNNLTLKQKIMFLFNTDIFKTIGSPDSETMREVYEDIKGLLDWAKEHG